jgi:hypothetical protein
MMSEWENADTLPTESGLYWVHIPGDREYLEGHLLYDYDDYIVLMNITVEDDEVHGSNYFGCGDESLYEVTAWWTSPVEIPTLSKAGGER